MKRFVRIFAASLILLSATIAWAEAPSYFKPDAVDPVKLIPPPPPIGSAEDRAELDLMLALQRSRTDKEVERCASEVVVGVEAFSSVMGPWFTAKNLPKLDKLFRKLQKDGKEYSDIAKDHFHRPRPATEDTRIHVPITIETSYSYPSGHATRGILFAMVLAEVLPEHRQALLERGEEIGWDRVIAGLHHPSDICAGRMLGQNLASSLVADPKFQAELAEIKEEIHHAEQDATATSVH